MAQDREALAATREHRAAHGPEILRDFASFLALDNVTGDLPALEANAASLVDRFEQRGASVATHAIPGAAGVVTGRLPADDKQRTLGVYVHYDGQPVDPGSWTSDPFGPVCRRGPRRDSAIVPFPTSGESVDPELRIYARGAADDKAPFAAVLAAIDALVDAGVERRTELVFLFEGEEESGSPHLPEYLALLRDDLAADLWLICDGPVHPSGRPQVAFGVRGYCGFDVTVYGPERELHSGHFGNWVPNPVHDLVRLLATMKDDDGTVLIDGFYDSTRPVTAADLAANAALPPVEGRYREELGFAAPEPPGGSYADHLLRPSFNIRGIRAADVGESARNVIPDEASASVDIRLAAGNDPDEMLDLVEAHVRRRGYVVGDRAPTGEERREHRRFARFVRDRGYPAARTPVDLAQTQQVVAAVEVAAGNEVVRLPTFGGSVPLHYFNEILEAPVALLPIANYDNNQHGADENLRVGNLWYGMDLWGVLLAGG